MKVIIAGSRGISDPSVVDVAMEEAWLKIRGLGILSKITEVVSGGADGVDTLGEAWASRRGIPVHRFPADWAKYGKAAGPVRNEEMASYADALVAVWDGKSRGTLDMIEKARRAGLKVYIHRA